MSARLKEYFTQPSPQEFARYTRRVTPPLDTQRLDMKFLVGDERRVLRTPTNGDATLVVIYQSKGKKSEGAVSSIAVQDRDLAVLQLQGARGIGYRVSTGLRWIDLFADKIDYLASHPDTGIERVILPDLLEIEGLTEEPETALPKYEALVEKLGMKHSKEEGQYVKDVKK